MVQPLSKLANPWKCDAPGCELLRARDTNHWMIVRREENCLRCDIHGTTAEHDLHLAQPMPGAPMFEVVISKWDDVLAEIEGARHVCGIDCALKVTARLMAETFFPADFQEKEVLDARND